MTRVTRRLTFWLPARISLSPSRVSLGLSRSFSHFRRLLGCRPQSLCLCLWVSVSPSLGGSAQSHICPSLPLSRHVCPPPSLASSHEQWSSYSSGNSQPISVTDTSFFSLSFPCLWPSAFSLSSFTPSPPPPPPLGPPLSLYSRDNSPLVRTPEIIGVAPPGLGA